MLAVLKKGLGIAQKIFLVVAVYVLVFGLFLHFAGSNKSQPKISPIERNRAEIYKNINDTHLNSTKEGKQQIASYRTSLCIMIGEGCTNKPSDGDRNFQKSIFGGIANLITTPFIHPPASGIAWVHDSLQNSGFIPKTYAAEGIGLASIRPFANIWIAIRNFTYVVLVIVLIAIGFMIMFRMKINPQTVISVENALPRIVLSLILITFSFAIAGFMIDLMYLTIILVISVLGGAGGLDIKKTTTSYLLANPPTIFTKVLGGQGGFREIGNFFELIGSLWVLLGGAIAGIIQAVGTTIIAFVYTIPFASDHFFKGLIKDLIPALQAGLLGNGTIWDGLKIIATIPEVLLSVTVGFALAFAGFNLLMVLIVLFTVIFVFFRIFLLLLNSYLKILLLVIFSPLYMLVFAFPGRNAFSSWLKSMIAELSAFPVAVAILVFGSILIDIPIKNGALLTPPFLHGLSPRPFAFLLGMGLLFSTPSFIKNIKQAIVPKPSPLLGGIGPGVFFGSAGAAAGGVGEIGQKYYQFSGLQQLFGDKGPFKSLLRKKTP